MVTSSPISNFLQDYGLWLSVLFLSLFLAQKILPLGVFMNQLIFSLKEGIFMDPDTKSVRQLAQNALRYHPKLTIIHACLIIYFPFKDPVGISQLRIRHPLYKADLIHTVSERFGPWDVG